MAKTKKEWTNHRGEVIPVRYIPALEIEEDKIAEKLINEAQKVSNKLKELKQKAFDMADAFYAKKRDEKLNAKTQKEGSEKKQPKGNYTITSFDKSLKIEVNINDVIEFDDDINLAQEKIAEFLDNLTQDAHKDLRVIVMNAFRTRKGKLDKGRVLELQNYKIEHPVWLEAMELIKSSIETNRTRRYMKMWIRDENGKYNEIPLSFPAI